MTDPRDNTDYRAAILNWLKGAKPGFLILMVVIFKPNGPEVHGLPFANPQKVQKAFESVIDTAKKEGYTVTPNDLGEDEEKQGIFAQVTINGDEDNPAMGIIQVQAWQWSPTDQDWH